MSMSQEEIEALMNASSDVAPAEEEQVTAEDDGSMSPDDIAALVAQSDTTEPAQNSDEDLPSEDDFLVVDSDTEETSEDSLDDLLTGIDGADEEIKPQDEALDSVDDILAGIDGVSDDESNVETPSDDSSGSPDVTEILNEKINEGVYPLPVEEEHKVVNQLSEVAEDSEVKATQIFDVLSFVLDENNEIQKNSKAMGDFINKQITLLEALSKKFPNVAVFSENLELAQSLSSLSGEISSKIEKENSQVFIAMDLMQYHDINRQKIERVMAVIRKLNNYLNGIFEDEGNKPEVQIAKHIAGDSSEVVSNDDLDSLIAEFNK